MKHCQLSQLKINLRWLPSEEPTAVKIGAEVSEADEVSAEAVVKVSSLQPLGLGDPGTLPNPQSPVVTVTTFTVIKLSTVSSHCPALGSQRSWRRNE